MNEVKKPPVATTTDGSGGTSVGAASSVTAEQNLEINIIVSQVEQTINLHAHKQPRKLSVRAMDRRGGGV